MEECLKESLAARIIHPSLSPARASFFSLLERKTRPCIDYSGINNITIKNRYPLLLYSKDFLLSLIAKVDNE